MSTDPERYKAAIGRFASGVTVIASGWGDELHAMTASSVASLSLEPLQLLVCIQRESRCATALPRAGAFSVNILRQDQDVLSRYFSGHWTAPTPPRFEFVPWTRAPRLKGVIAALACDLRAIHASGDHLIVVGDVIDDYRGPGNEPLL